MTVIVITTFIAALITGGMGYGFSSITAPIGLLFLSNRILNPALVLVELGANIYSLFLNRKSAVRIFKRVWPILIGLVPSIVLGSFLLQIVDSNAIKIVTYCALAPLILIQSFGLRRPHALNLTFGVIVGSILGTLYSTTTISGPPLAFTLNNQGYEKDDFRAALAVVRSVESVCTAIAYLYLGIFDMKNLELFGWIAPGVLVAMPLGSVVFSKLNPFIFRRVCISFNVWLVGFGLSRVLMGAHLVSPMMSYVIMATMIIIDAFALTKFFQKSSPCVVSQTSAQAAEKPDFTKSA